jgi:subtilase family serine protease
LVTSGLSAVALADPSANGLSHRHVQVCSDAAAGQAACNAIRDDLVDSDGNVVHGNSNGNGNGNGGVGNPDKGKPAPPPTPPPTGPRGLHPADIEAAYGLATSTSNTPLVAIVDAYDDPTAGADLAVYRAQLGLPGCGAGCFSKVNQSGGTTPPAVNAGWAQEISLDLDMVSAACPSCHILLVEANSASFADLGTAVNQAATMGAVAISNSYGGSDFSQSQIPGYDHPGIAITASTGDNGYGVESPASFPTVIAVGGTSLAKTSSGYSETAWSGAGSGCSSRNTKPGWQTAATSCSGKADADVSAVADPNTGVSVYDTTAYQGVSGWLVFGGTSASSPIVASVYALGGNHGFSYPAQYTWGQKSGVHDVTSGSNGHCSTSVWCHAGPGWDGPTGLGTPNGTGAF